jgi:hypothetical protein
MHILLRQRTSLNALLVIASLTLALVCFVPSAAHAFTIEYSCNSCAAEHGSEHNDSENGGNAFANLVTNHSGKGVCSAIWRNEGGGKWHEYLSCTSAGTVDELKIAEYFTGHGEVRRYYKEYLYNLSGFEYNYST